MHILFILEILKDVSQNQENSILATVDSNWNASLILLKLQTHVTGLYLQCYLNYEGNNIIKKLHFGTQHDMKGEC